MRRAEAAFSSTLLSSSLPATSMSAKSSQAQLAPWSTMPLWSSWCGHAVMSSLVWSWSHSEKRGYPFACLCCSPFGHIRRLSLRKSPIPTSPEGRTFPCPVLHGNALGDLCGQRRAERPECVHRPIRDVHFRDAGRKVAPLREARTWALWALRSSQELLRLLAQNQPSRNCALRVGCCKRPASWTSRFSLEYRPEHRAATPRSSIRCPQATPHRGKGSWPTSSFDVPVAARCCCEGYAGSPAGCSCSTNTVVRLKSVTSWSARSGGESDPPVRRGGGCMSRRIADVGGLDGAMLGEGKGPVAAPARS